MAKIKNVYKFLKNKKILVTGHTGFKGSWLALWLLKIGCNVIGISKDLPTEPSNYNHFQFKKKMKNYFFNLKNLSKLKKVIFLFRDTILLLILFFFKITENIFKKQYKKDKNIKFKKKSLIIGNGPSFKKDFKKVLEQKNDSDIFDVDDDEDNDYVNSALELNAAAYGVDVDSIRREIGIVRPNGVKTKSKPNITNTTKVKLPVETEVEELD